MRRHGIDLFALACGTIFSLIGLGFLVSWFDFDSLRLGWIWPIPLIALGIVIIVASARRELSHQDEQVAQPESAMRMSPPSEPM